MRVAIVHDYLTQRGGAERVVLAMHRAFPDAPIYTSLYHPDGTFPEFSELDVRPSVLQRIPALSAHHRLGLPLYATTFSRMRVDADVVLCSSSGWAHGVSATGPKVVYCYNPPRWVYQQDQYLRPGPSLARVAAPLARRPLAALDRKAAATAVTYLTSSSVVADRIRSAYRVDATVLPPPPAITPSTTVPTAVPGIDPGYLLVVSRLLPYKNLDAIVHAMALMKGERLVLVGEGPERDRLASQAGTNVAFLGRRTDAELAWLYTNASALVAASREDFGLTPLEAAGFGTPSLVLRWGGFLDTMTDATAEFFEQPSPEAIERAVGHMRDRSWNSNAIQEHASAFDEGRFVTELRRVVGDVRSDASSSLR
jgi:glycosyltransferase involved in cell wall biosynthesis